MFGENGQDRYLRAEVPRVDDVHALLHGALGIVVLHIARDIDICAAPYGVVDKLRARSPADGRAPHGTRGSCGKAHMRDAEALLHRAGKVLHGHRCGERPHTPDALGDAVLPARDDEGGELFEAEMRGEHIVHAAMRRIIVHAADALTYLREQQDDSYDVVYFDPMFRRPLHESAGMNALRVLADMRALTEEAVAEACRVARRRSFMTTRRESAEFARLGFDTLTGGKYSRIAYGVMELNK